MKYLRDLWDESIAAKLPDDLELLRYRSNLLGADLRITNFGGGNTSSKINLSDPFNGNKTQVLAVKGSGGDIGSIKREGFALVYMDRLVQLQSVYKGEALEDEMVGYYPLAAFGDNRVAASIDTPLHAFLPFPHVDHLHPDWAIAIAASANGREKMEQFNKQFGHKMVWLPWQRPGFELGLMLQKAVADNPGCDGIFLGSHGLFTWGMTQRECYLNSVTAIDQMGQFVMKHQKAKGAQLFSGAKFAKHKTPNEIARAIFPYLRGQCASTRRNIGHFDQSPEALTFANSEDAKKLSALGTSCPDHFIRTRICPFYVEWNPQTGTIDGLKKAIANGLVAYRENYTAYYNKFATADSPKLRDANPSVVLIPGIGMFTFSRNKKEARITGEFYRNAIGVMAGATSMDDGSKPKQLPQAKTVAANKGFASYCNYVALPPFEAFRIEYWALEEAKIQRMPAEAEFSRKVVLVVGGGNGIGRLVALILAKQGAHLVIADRDLAAAQAVAAETKLGEAVHAVALNLVDRKSLRAAITETVLQFGGIDSIINTAAVFFAPDTNGNLPDDQWGLTFDINVTGNHLLVDEARSVLADQALSASIVLTSSANAVVAKRGSEAYDVSKSAVNHLIRSMAVGLKPHVRVNGIAPATVVEGSTMFPRDRVIASLAKYTIPYTEQESTESLREKLAGFYAKRTLLNAAIRPQDCAEAIVWLASDRSSRTTGHVIPVDGGLVEAFLR